MNEQTTYKLNGPDFRCFNCGVMSSFNSGHARLTEKHICYECDTHYEVEARDITEYYLTVVDSIKETE